MNENHEELLAQAFGDYQPQDPTTGDLDLAERNSFRRVSTTIRAEDTTDGYEVEYRKLRLEQVVLVGVWTEGTVAEVEATMAELAALTETAGAEVVEAIYQNVTSRTLVLTLAAARYRTSKRLWRQRVRIPSFVTVSCSQVSSPHWSASSIPRSLTVRC